MSIPRQFQHGMLPQPDHDEMARRDFILAYRMMLGKTVSAGNHRIWSGRVGPAFHRKHQRDPQMAREVKAVMTKDPYYQFYASMQRNNQELLWDAIIDTVERQLPDLIDKAKRLTGQAAGTLRLDPNFQTPHYLTTHDIHLQPGGYRANYVDGDISAGALNECHLHDYSMGQFGDKIEFLGHTNLGLFKELFAGFVPERMLDMGCGVGNSINPWAEEFPDVEFYGIDIGPALLRYGHARAESMGVKIHFSQQCAEHTDFEDESFDVVTSHIMMHETSRDAVAKIFAESRRLLRPGGVMLHFDLPRFVHIPPVEAFLASWEVDNNGEHFGGTYRVMDIVAEARKGGWQEDEVGIRGAKDKSNRSISNYGPPVPVWPTLTGLKGGRLP